MLYRKNIFQWEQGLRIVAGLGLAVLVLALDLAPAWPWLAGGGVLVVTGLFGFCPACYMVGRRTPSFRAAQDG